MNKITYLKKFGFTILLFLYVDILCDYIGHPGPGADETQYGFKSFLKLQLNSSTLMERKCDFKKVLASLCRAKNINN